MRCVSGKHEWIDPISAERCCSGRWYRALRHIDDVDDLDPNGRTRVAGEPFVNGWVRLPEDVME